MQDLSVKKRLKSFLKNLLRCEAFLRPDKEEFLKNLQAFDRQQESHNQRENS